MADAVLLSVDEHAASVRALLSRTPIEHRPLASCLRLALAADLVTPIALPPFDNSSMDGYAVRSADVAGASPSRPVELPVAEDIPAGRVDDLVLATGTAHRIMTGALLPAGADTVVPVEQTDGGMPLVRVFAPVAAGRYVRRAAEDVRAGQVVLPAGTTLGAVQLGLAAAVGYGALPVHRPPRVLVISTGSELVEPGSPLRPGQIYESNGPMLAAALRAAACEPSLVRFVTDDVAAFHATLTAALAATGADGVDSADSADGADLVLTSGGVSAGAYEVVKDALAAHGVTFVKVGMNPGMPQGAGVYGGTPVVTLPGNPVSALVSFEVFVRPALRAAAGHTVVHRQRVPARLVSGTSSPAGKRQYLRGVLFADGTVSLVGGPGSHLLGAFAAANCLVELPEEVTDVAAGATVTVHILTP